jgi:hypothetical protein
VALSALWAFGGEVSIRRLNWSLRLRGARANPAPVPDGSAAEGVDMAATRNDQRVLVIALVLALVAMAVMIGDKLTNADIANRETFDLLQLVFSAVALVCGVVVIVRHRRRPPEDDQVIDLRERLHDLVDLDDTTVDEELRLDR